ncbi:DUF1080 domain-containing protein [Stieleria sp. TO1_6]|uniref:family 16 glycoside hydrolase n=1 Tax=Stieleria tagensis TaxID=2956795 RepID=UPI00209ABBBC|nr:family 16 glycoside hydrolase [Stieleria tagensis]MCO8125195.1 DUF1080 domain-containing protein [Stieleria tagensis]
MRAVTLLRVCVYAWLLVCLPTGSFAEQPINDPDFQVQGEYVGQGHTMQVIARGDGEFAIVVYDGHGSGAGNSTNPPRRLDGDEDTVAELVEALDLEPGQRKSSTLGAPPPSGATVLFDGSQASLAHWINGKLSADGDLIPGTQTKQHFRDYTLHLEFRTPWMPNASGQQRGNSGVYHQGRYETQILDSFGLEGADNETGAIYEIKAPDTNACLPPMQWQTYDIDFTAARYQADKKIADARITVRLNNVTVQNDVVIPTATRAAKLAEGPSDGPIYLQDHGNPVRFRNIWLLPRDAQREAARPIIPGFERFFANAVDDKGLGGELLISSLGCTACHQGAESILPVKRGPVLSDVAQRLRPDAVLEMIANPHQTKRGTAMPDPWAGADDAQRLTAAKALASYVLLSGSPSQLLDRPTQSSVIKRGKQLYHSVGCVACHIAFDGSQTPASTSVPLGKLESKYTVDSLAQLISNPHQIRSGSRMPSLVGSSDDAYAIASYLTRRVTERKSKAKFKRQIYKGDWDKLPDFDQLTPISVDEVSTLEIKRKADPKHTGMVFESQLLIRSAGEYEFFLQSDDGARLFVGTNVIDHDGIHPNTTKSETFALEPGLHQVRVEWFNKAGEIDLQVRVNDPLLGTLPLHDMISDGNTDQGPLLENRFQPDPNLASQGKRLFQTAGCASCHAFQSIQPTPSSAPALADLRSDRGCMAAEVQSPAVDFLLSRKQSLAIARAIELRKQHRSQTTVTDDHDRVHLMMAGLNCYACHRRGEIGGPEPTRDSIFQTTTKEMGWEGRLPPPLDGVADKLNAKYLGKILADGAHQRAYMLTRMPGFGADALQPLQDSLTRLDQQQTKVTVPPHWPSSVPDGRKLVGGNGLSCIKCHSYDNVTGGGLGVIDLLAMPDRLRRDWFARYLKDPTRYRPGTRMPNSFPDGRSAFTKLYDGDPDKQIAAMWDYLQAGKSVKEPAGLRPGAILLTAAERPRIYRNFFEDVSGRGIAVGYPGGLNLIWDAERMGLNKVWKHEFIDAARHWTGRGQGRTTPAGDQVNGLEPWTPLAIGDTLEMTWPSDSGRERGYRFLGYRLDTEGNPTFRYRIGDITINDSIAPAGENALMRTLTVWRPSDRNDAGVIWRLARAEKIEVVDGGFQIGAVRISIENANPKIIAIENQSELRLALPPGESVTVTERIQW